MQKLRYRVIAVLIGALLVAASCSVPGTSSYTITYNANGADGGSVPVASESFTAGATATIRENSGNLTRAGFPFFIGWNTRADGTGTEYLPGASFSAGGDLTLYALWIAGEDLIPSGLNTNDNYGWSVAVDGNYAAVGAMRDDAVRVDAGAVYLYRRQGSNWRLEDTLYPRNEDAVESGLFGGAVAISGDLLAVGAPRDTKTTPNANGRGGVYVYRRSHNGDWTQEKFFRPSATNPRFGVSVAISGNTVVAGTEMGSEAYVMHYNSNTRLWSNPVSLVAMVPSGGAVQNFGRFVAISGDTMVVSAQDNTSFVGVFHVYVRDGEASWRYGEELSVAQNQVAFSDVAIDGDRIVVGAANDSRNAANAGVVHVFERGGDGRWREVRTISAANGLEDDRFGSSVAVYGDNLAIGASGRGGDIGAVYVYQRNSSGSWSPAALLDTDQINGKMGESVAMDAHHVISGAAGIFWNFSQVIGEAYIQRYR